MLNPHIHVPYDKIKEHLDFIRRNRLNLEIYFSADALDSAGGSDIVDLKNSLDYGPSLSMHAPFMDLSPGAVDPKIRDVTRERFSQAIDAAESLGAGAVVFHSGYEKWKYSHNTEIWLEGCLRVWPEIIKRASHSGILVAVENVFEDNPDNMVLLMKEIDSGSMGICFDTGHFNIFSSISLEDWLERIKPYLMELHIHDNDKGYDAHLPIGEGSFDFETMFRLLDGIDIIYTVEAHTQGGAMKSLDILKRYHHRLST